MSRLGFIGFGLIGASIAKSLKSKVPGKYDIYVYDYRKEVNPALMRALSDGVVNKVSKEFDIVFKTDILFLCAPTLKNIAYLSELKERADVLGVKLPLITDVGSVKGNIVNAAKDLGISSRFIGGHPMAGSEKTGYDNANDHLLENAYYILTPALGSSDEDLKLLREVVKDTGAMDIILDADTHDRVTAAISHLPHIVAAELVNLVQDSGDDTEMMRMLAAGGFKDITRIASSSPEMWKSILLSNQNAILDALDRFQDALVRCEAAIVSGNADYIYKSFDRAGDFRSRIPDAHGMLKPSYRFYVDLKDKAGAIATIATLLVVDGISLKNIGIVHNRDYEQGVLRVEFYDKKAEDKAAEILESYNYTIYRI